MSPAEMQILVSRAGLVLNPGQVADLVLAWRQLAGLIARVPHDRKLVDDMAIGFRLAPPAAGDSGPKPVQKAPAKTSPKAATKAAAKTRAGAGSGKRPPARSAPASARALTKAKPAKRAKRAR